jgi:cation:H+ antiporter
MGLVAQPSDPVGRQLLSMAVAIGLATAGVLVGLSLLLELDVHVPAWVQLTILGSGMIGAALILMWTAEAAELDLTPALATWIWPWVALFPEWIITAMLAWGSRDLVGAFGGKCSGDTGQNPCSLAMANIVGSTRFLIGIGWAVVVLTAALRFRQRGERRTYIALPRTAAVEIAYFALACSYVLAFPMKRSITAFDTITLGSILLAYMLRITRAPDRSPDLIGPSLYIASFSRGGRRVLVAALFVIFGVTLAFEATYFVQSLIGMGRHIGISSFVLAQWWAPVATVFPELLVAGLYAWRLSTTEALGALLVRVTQITLLISLLPIVVTSFLVGSYGSIPIGLVDRQSLLVTAAQGVLLVAILVDRSLSIREGALLLGLFCLQGVATAIWPSSTIRDLSIAAAYILIGIWYLSRSPRNFRAILRDGFRTPYNDLQAEH